MADIASARIGETNAKDREITSNKQQHMLNVASMKRKRLANFSFRSTVL